MLYETLEEKLEKYVNLRGLPVREFHKESVEKYSAYPIWTCDFEGSCLVGAEKFEIEPIDLILHVLEMIKFFVIKISGLCDKIKNIKRN